MAILRQRKPGGNWHAVFVERGGGKRRNIEISLKTHIKHKAQEALSKLIEERRKGGGGFSIHLDKRFFVDVATDWLEARKAELKRKTAVFYEERLKHLKVWFKNYTVDGISTSQIERYKNGRLKSGLSARTVNMELHALYAVLEYAVRLNYCRENVCRLVRRVKQDKKRFPALTKDDLIRLLDTMPAGRTRTFIIFLLGTGLRVGEALGARWKNVNWKAETYDVNEAFDGKNFQTPKTISSIRTVSLPSSVLTALRDFRKEQMNKILPEAAKGCGLIFHTSTGKPLSHRSVRRWIDSALKRLKKEGNWNKPVRVHDLRAAFATMSLESGANIKAVQTALGHSTSRMTMEVYSRLTQDSRQEAAQKLEAHLFTTEPQAVQEG